MIYVPVQQQRAPVCYVRLMYDDKLPACLSAACGTRRDQKGTTGKYKDTEPMLYSILQHFQPNVDYPASVVSNGRSIRGLDYLYCCRSGDVVAARSLLALLHTKMRPCVFLNAFSVLSSNTGAAASAPKQYDSTRTDRQTHGALLRTGTPTASESRTWS